MTFIVLFYTIAKVIIIFEFAKNKYVIFFFIYLQYKIVSNLFRVNQYVKEQNFDITVNNGQNHLTIRQSMYFRLDFMF
jgi:hypothetical protein